ncbi:MAG: geranylgeranyl reductase family protein [Thermoplasmata archaeon]|nr:geranylgeranyl reductase family protein [Thermoplasmata archaeon]
MEYDVIIIGAGPAGTAVANVIQNTELSCLLIDKKQFPRAKPCGGVLPPRIYSELDIPEHLKQRDLDGYRLFSHSGLKVESKFPKPGLIVDRTTFDEFLVKSLKIKMKKAQISGLNATSDYVEVIGKNDTFCAKIVVGADGVNSVVRKACNINLETVATTAQYEFSVPQETIDERIGNWFEVYYIIPNGYGWIVPLKDRVKVGMGSISPEFKNDLRAQLDKFLTHPIVAEKIKDCELKNFEVYRVPMGGPSNRLTDDRTLLVGDAGGFVYPGTGEGVYYSIKSGRVAAETLLAILEAGQFDQQSLNKLYIHNLTANGLLALRDTKFLKKTLATPMDAERYVKKLSVLRTQ